MRVTITGSVKDHRRNERPGAFLVVVKHEPPRQLVHDYIQYYLDVAPEHIAANGFTSYPEHISCAVLTYQYLRPQGEMFVPQRYEFGGTTDGKRLLHSDEFCDVYEA